MYIKNISLINFQKHSSLQIDFCEGVNVLYGSSDAGKSCIRRALEWICQNENFDGVRKTGSKKTIVTITLDNNIEIERVRSQSINRYIIREGKEERVFDSIGKNIPEEVKELLTIYPIEVDGEEIYLNSQPQISLPFLFDKSPSFRMKLFNRLTGNDVLDKLFGQFNKDILRIKRGYKEETERFEENAIKLKEKQKEKEKAEAIHTRLKKRVENIKKLHEKYSKLMKIKDLEEANLCNLQEAKCLLGKIKFPEDTAIKRLSINIERFEKLKTTCNASEKVDISLDRVRGQLSDLCLPELDFATLKAQIERYDALQYINFSLDSNQEARYNCKGEIKYIKIALNDKIKDYKNLLKEAKVCPVCQHIIDESHINGIRL